MTNSKQDSAQTTDAQQGSSSGESRPRRSFLIEFGSIAIGGIISLFSVLAGLVVFFDPLSRKPKIPKLYRENDSGGNDGFVRVATLDAIPKDGTPVRVVVIDDRIDAWNFIPDQPVGAVFLRRIGKGDDVRVFHSTCPHAGCPISFASQEKQFRCPCHNSAFDLDGKKVDLPGKLNPSPRPMDPLEIDKERLADSREVWIRFLNFETGKHEMKPKI